MKHPIPFLLVLALTAAGCASNPLQRQDPALEEEVRQLRQRIVELQREARMNEVEVTRLRQQVAEMEARSGGARPSSPSPPSSVTTAPPSTTTTRPAAPRTTTPAPTTPRTTAPAPAPQRPAAPRPAPVETVEEFEEEDLEVPQPEPQRPAPAPSNPSPAAPAPAESGDDSELLNPSAQALYDRGYTLYHQGRFVDAETSFQRFLQTNQDSELADNAQYWIGECRYARADTRGALAAFREVIEKFPKGNKVPDALLKAGQSLETLGDIEGARVTYREVGRRFPGTTAAAVAEERRGKLP